MRQRQEAVKLFIAAMHDNTMRDRWFVNEEWVRHIRAYGHDISIHDMNMGIFQRCDWCNNQFIIDGYLLLHNVKAIHHQMKDPKKIKKMRFYYVVSLGQLAPTIPSVQKFYQDLWNDRKMSKRSLKQSAQDDCSKQEQPSNKKQARQQLPKPVSPTSTLDSPLTSLDSPSTSALGSLPASLDSPLPSLLDSPSTSLAADSPSTSLDSLPSTSFDSLSDPPETFKCALDMLACAWKENTNI
jgi:hypothetical protein